MALLGQSRAGISCPLFTFATPDNFVKQVYGSRKAFREGLPQRIKRIAMNASKNSSSR